VHETPSFVNAAHSMGASGYIFKSQISRDLLKTLRSVSSGTRFVSSVSDE
jgi:DNA-binding NarL/FixJ family response regulator